MRDAGLVEEVSRGLYRLPDMLPMGNLDLVTVALRVPESIICLISALAFFEITTQVPHEVHIARTKGAEPPRLMQPPVRVFWFGQKAFSAGIETHVIDAVPVRIYCLEKTIADCFKFRNKIGLDVALEALRNSLQDKICTRDEIWHFAKINRVTRIIRPYMEAMT